MLHIGRLGAGSVPNHVLKSMFAARKSVFIDLLRWGVPVLDGAYEVDQFDTEHASYLVLTDREGCHLGSARLLPTMRPHILDSFYPELCGGNPPRAQDVFEVTRFCLDRSLNSRERRVVRNTLVTALAEHAIANGISGYSAIAELGWLQQILAFGWACRPLGLPVAFGGKMLGALAIKIETNTPELLRAAGIRALPLRFDHETRVAA